MKSFTVITSRTM